MAPARYQYRFDAAHLSKALAPAASRRLTTANPSAPTTGTPQAPSPWPQGDVYDFLQNWYSKHDPKEGIGPLAEALGQQGFSDYGGRYLVDGRTPSDNELVIGGEKWKVLGGESSASPFWFIPGSEDGATAPTSSRSPYGDPYLAAQAAASSQRRRAGVGGRHSTIHAGFRPGMTSILPYRPGGRV